MGNLVHELVLDGWDVRATGIHGSETKFIKGLPAEIVFSDLSKVDEVEPLVAIDTSLWNKTKECQGAINVDG